LISADTAGSDAEIYPAFDIARDMFESKYNDPAEIKLCLDEISMYLNYYDLEIKDESNASGGKIKLYISGAKVFFAVTGGKQRPVDLVRKRTDHISEGADDLAEATQNANVNVKRVKGDKIRHALIEFYNSDNDLIGRATIDGEEITTSLIARVIKSLITRNKW
jgi:hypothetical protein